MRRIGVFFVLDFDKYCEASRPGANTKTRAYMLLNIAGKEAIERSRTFEYGEGESAENVEDLKRKFKELCEPNKNITMLRHRFNDNNITHNADDPVQTMAKCMKSTAKIMKISKAPNI